MGNADLLDQVRRLRSDGRSPKEIARALRLAPSAVVPLVRAVAVERRETAGHQDVVGCWINTGWSSGLTVDGSRDWSDHTTGQHGTEGLVVVLVARRHRWDKVSVYGYLADVYCLGIKNVLGPEIMDELALRRFLPEFYAAYPGGWQDADFELARHIVFGAVDYASSLGFEPAVEFTPAAALHLGAWEGPCAITFGQDGTPFYASGPRDNPGKVMRTLERTVGPPPNFGFLIGSEDMSVFDTLEYVGSDRRFS